MMPCVLTPEGDFLTNWVGNVTSNGQCDDPFGAAVYPNCAVYGEDRDNNSIQVFRPVT